MGPAAANMRSAVIDEVLAFVKRLPGVEQLTFSDGTPFADEATKAWLATCQAERSGGGPTDKFSEAKKQANESVGLGDSDAAVAALQDFGGARAHVCVSAVLAAIFSFVNLSITAVRTRKVSAFALLGE